MRATASPPRLVPGTILAPVEAPGVAAEDRRLLVGAEFTSSWCLKSWDRFHLPKPFSRVRMRCEIIEPEQLADRDAGIELVRSRLLALNPDR